MSVRQFTPTNHRKWVSTPLRAAFMVLNGATPTSSEQAYWGEDIFWATPEDIGSLQGKILTTTRRKLTKEGYLNSGTKIAPPGSIILTSRAPVGNLALAGIPLCTNQGCKTLVPLSNAIDTSFVYYQLLARRAELIARATGSTFVEIGADELRSFEILLPPLSTQHGIAAYLDRETAKIDALIAAKQRQIELLAEKRQALITQSVIRGIDPMAPMKDSGVEWLGEIPAHWEVELSRRFIQHIEQGWSPIAEDRLVENGEWGVIKISAIKAGNFFTDEHKALPLHYEIPSHLEIKPGDFLLTRGNTPLLVGDVCVVEKTRPRLILPDLVYRLQLDASYIDANYLKYILLSPVGRFQIEIQARGSSQSMVKISQEHIKEWLVPLPPLKEQQAIVSWLDRALAEIRALQAITERTISLLQQRRESLISAAVTGQLGIGE